MKKVFKDPVKVVIDVGTTKIITLVCRQHEGKIEVLGYGKAPSLGLKRGVVVDVERTVASIKTSVQEAEFISGYQVETAYIGISGSHIHAVNSAGAVPIRKRIVAESDIQAAVQAAQAIKLPEGQQILHVLPRYFRIDGSERLKNPLGMSGVRLEVEVHMITASVSAAQNLIRCCELAGIKVDDIILEHIASAEAVCTDAEKDLGVGILDIGGGTADFAVYQAGSVAHTHVIPIAGNMFTSDIAIGLATTTIEAIRLKEQYASAMLDVHRAHEPIKYLKAHGLEHALTSHQELVAIVQPRAQELFGALARVVREFQLHEKMSAGLVLTGGGSMLHGIEEIAYQELLMPVRIGMPHIRYQLPESMNHPLFATGYGLALYAFGQQPLGGSNRAEGPLATRVFARMKNWMADFF